MQIPLQHLDLTSYLNFIFFVTLDQGCGEAENSWHSVVIVFVVIEDLMTTHIRMYCISVLYIIIIITVLYRWYDGSGRYPRFLKFYTARKRQLLRASNMPQSVSNIVRAAGSQYVEAACFTYHVEKEYLCYHKY